MVEDSLITEELRSKIGIEWEPVVCEIEKGMIQRFAQAIDDSNPLWQDEEYARKSRYGGIIAPPTFIQTAGWGQFEKQFQLQVAPSLGGGRLNGGVELEYYQPVRPGDTITVITKITNVRERQGRKMGKMMFVTLDVTYKNQRQELVAKCQQTIIGYKIEGTGHG